MRFDHTQLPGQKLAMTPSAWDVRLPGDDALVIYAVGYGPEQGQIDYNVLLAGRPPKLMAVVSGPADLLDDVYTEEPEDLPANDFEWNTAVCAVFAAVPDVWRLGLAGGHELLVYANDMQTRRGEHLFTLAVRGGGPSLPVVRLSNRLVVQMSQQPTEPANPPRSTPEDA